MRDSPRQYRERRFARGATRTLDRLDLELSLGTARRHLDPLVELAELYLEGVTATGSRAAIASRLEHTRRLVATRINLRLCKGRPAND